tara:strand:- start:34 stop:579 length:546 start_codon:yes stop_codon:yes gene_type:complete
MHKDYFFHIPELDLDDEKRDILYKKYLVSKITHKGYNRHTHQYLKTFHTEVDVLKQIYSDEIIQQIQELCKEPPIDKFNRGTSFEFLKTQGKVEIHRDPVRLAVLVIPLLNKDNNKLEFWNEEQTKIIKELNYGTKTYIMRTRVPHSVSTSKKPRVFWQGSIFTRDFDEVLKEYSQGRLFK